MESICVGIVITIVLLVVIYLFAMFMEWLTDDSDFAVYFSYMVSTIGFGICLTILLYRSGIL